MSSSIQRRSASWFADRDLVSRVARLASMLALGLGFAGSVVLPAGAAEPAARSASPSAVRGKQLYFSVGCVYCHGSAGQGSVSGARLAPDPLPAEAIAAFVRATNTTMPPYGAEVLSDADVADIAAYLRTIPPAKSPDDIPALRAVQATPQSR